MIPFKDLSPLDRAQLRYAHLCGKTIQNYTTARGWKDCTVPSWHDVICYRIKPDTEETKMRMFKDLSREEQLLLFAAWLDGETIMSNGAHPTLQPQWDRNTVYTVAAHPDQIDWGHVAPEYKFMARDHDGGVHLFLSAPTISFSEWFTVGGRAGVAHASYRRGTCDWKDSLVVRP